jgi:hypothetical protein
MVNRKMWIKPRAVVLPVEHDGDPALKVWELRLFDEGVGVHLCEFLMSRELWYLDFETDPDVDDNEWFEWSVSCSEPEVQYIHDWDLGKYQVVELPSWRCRKEDQEEAWEGLLEYYRENPPWFAMLLTKEDV